MKARLLSSLKLGALGLAIHLPACLAWAELRAQPDRFGYAGFWLDWAIGWTGAPMFLIGAALGGWFGLTAGRLKSSAILFAASWTLLLAVHLHSRGLQVAGY